MNMNRKTFSRNILTLQISLGYKSRWKEINVLKDKRQNKTYKIKNKNFPVKRHFIKKILNISTKYIEYYI